MIKELKQVVVTGMGAITPLNRRLQNKFNLMLGKAQAKEINCAMSNTFGFGGHIVIFKKYKN